MIESIRAGVNEVLNPVSSDQLITTHTGQPTIFTNRFSMKYFPLVHLLTGLKLNRKSTCMGYSNTFGIINFVDTNVK